MFARALLTKGQARGKRLWSEGFVLLIQTRRRRRGLLDQELSAVSSCKDYGSDSHGMGSLRKKDKGWKEHP